MNIREWALVTFTILAQMSVGSFVVLGFVHFFAVRKAGSEEADRLSDRVLLAIGGVLILAMIASLLHLGNPTNAYRAVTNFGSSWLSREITFLVSFMIVGGAFALMQWRKIASFAVLNVVAWIAALLGLGLVYSMSSIYMLDTQPTWNSLATPIGFFTTTILLGLLAIGSALAANYAYVRRKYPECADVQCNLLRNVVRWISLASVVFLGVEFVMIPMYLGTLVTGGSVAASGVSMMVTGFSLVLIFRLVLAFLGAGVFTLFLFQTATQPGREKMLGYLVYSAFALVLIAEVLGRFLFYATQSQIGI
jgi:anaerobic dimethyl sulfoxide reductase subunit C (anchor subunit)